MAEETNKGVLKNCDALNQTENKNNTSLNNNENISQSLTKIQPNQDESKKNAITDSKTMTNKKKAFLQFVIFALFSASAGIIQMLSFECLYHWIGWNNWWATYLISLTLSVIWNFTFNRKFTFKSSSNVPVSMTLVLLYYCAFTPISVFGGQALESVGWNGTVVTVIMMLLNFVTEFFFDKYVTFNDNVVSACAKKFSKKKDN